MTLNHITIVDILMAHNADMDLPDADGWTARTHFPGCGPQVTAVMTKWIRFRQGEDAPHAEKRCDTCGVSVSTLKSCGKCKVAQYCSRQCQGLVIIYDKSILH